MKHVPITVLAALVLSGCLAKSIAVPVEDHYVQTKTVADRCRKDGCDEVLQEDLDETATQACLLEAAVKKADPAEHCPQD